MNLSKFNLMLILAFIALSQLFNKEIWNVSKEFILWLLFKKYFDILYICI